MIRNKYMYMVLSTFRERNRERVKCGDCGKEVAAGSLDSHRMSQHGKAQEKRWTCTDAATGGWRRVRATDIPDRVPQEGGRGVSSGRLSGEGRDTDGDVGALLDEAWEGYSDHIGGGKPPSSKMPTL